MNIAVFSVVHPKAFPYFNDFLFSLATQTNKDFSLFLVNDGTPGVEETIHQYNLNVVLRNLSGTPSAIRKSAIEWILSQSVDIIIFADTDDCFMNNRIEICKSNLLNYSIMFNELILIGDNITHAIPMLGKRFKNNEIISLNNIKYSNCMGFSNTAIKTKVIPKSVFQIPDDIIAFDWAFFSLCMQEELKAVFTKQTATYYRQHNDNIASPQSFTEDQILRGVRVKRDHYRFISRIDAQYESLSNQFSALFEKLSGDVSFRNTYCESVKDKTPQNLLWWESIKSLEELAL